MKLNAKVGIATAISALAMTAPAVAQACNNGQGSQVRERHGTQSDNAQGAQGGSDHGQFTRFGRRGRSFGRSGFGILVSWTATQTGTNTYSGSITVSKPAFKAHHANGKSGSTQPTQQSTQVTYTFTNAKVFFGQGANPPAAGDLVKVIGSRLGHGQSTGAGTSTSTGNVRAIFIAVPRSSSQL